MLHNRLSEIRVDGSPTTFLRRPISINYVDRQRNEVWFLIQLVGDGTKRLGEAKSGDIVNVVLPLGNCFTMPEKASDKLLLVGGGVGTAPMLYLGEQLAKRGCKPTFLLGARSDKDLLQLEQFAAYGEVYTTTEDGSHGEKGYVTQHSILNKVCFEQIYTCGPKPMMMAVAKYAKSKGITLPWARRCATAAVSYLQKRGISSEVIRQCLQAGIFYEARYHGEPVCVFVGKDDSGKAKFACMRSISGNLKKDVYGSDKGYNFCYPPQSPGSRHVAVFEAPIDALSHATLQELEGWKWNGYRLSLGGTSHVALTSFLERHPEIRRVTLYMDHDLAGFVNARKIKTMLHEDKRFRHIRVSVNPPRMGKDYNEKLLLVREQLQTSQHQRRPKEAAVSI